MPFLAPKYVPPPAPAPVANADIATVADQAADAARKRAAAAAGRQSTILTNPLGTPATGAVQTKTLLGQ